MVKSRKTSMKHKKRTNSKKNMIGGYTAQQNQQLLDVGFTEQFLQIVSRARIGFNMLFNNFQQSNLTAQQYMQQTYADLDINPDEGFTDEEDNDDDEQEGGKKRNKKTKKCRTRKCKTRKHNRNNKKGGTGLIGRGYGANCSEPNYNIYNTNLLKLFPYNPK